mgnify:CR=1 FL=1
MVPIFYYFSLCFRLVNFNPPFSRLLSRLHSRQIVPPHQFATSAAPLTLTVTPRASEVMRPWIVSDVLRVICEVGFDYLVFGVGVFLEILLDD